MRHTPWLYDNTKDFEYGMTFLNLNACLVNSKN